MDKPYGVVEIEEKWITLGQFLKKVNEVNTGGEVKSFLQEDVYVNGILETRRGRKLFAGDEIFVKGRHRYLISQKKP